MSQPVALITGASRGIGLALARKLAGESYRLGLLARSPVDLERAAKEIGAGERLLRLPADVSDPGAVERAFVRLQDAYGGVDLVVHCAGILRTGRYDEIPIESYKRLMEVNYLGAVNVVRSALARMTAADSGHLVLVGSLIAVRSFPGFAAYAPTKWALRAFHETLEMELRGSRVRLSLAYPPITDTGMVRALPPSERPAIYDVFQHSPVDRVASALANGIRRGRRRIFVRQIDRLYFHCDRLAPRTTGRLLERFVARRPARGGVQEDFER